MEVIDPEDFNKKEEKQPTMPKNNVQNDDRKSSKTPSKELKPNKELK